MTKNGELSWGDFSPSLKWATGLAFSVIMAGTGTILVTTGTKLQEFDYTQQQMRVLNDSAVTKEKLADTILPIQIQINELKKSVDELRIGQQKTNDGIIEILKRLD